MIKKKIMINVDSVVYDALIRNKENYGKSISKTVNDALRFHFFDEFPDDYDGYNWYFDLEGL